MSLKTMFATNPTNVLGHSGHQGDMGSLGIDHVHEHHLGL